MHSHALSINMRNFTQALCALMLPSNLASRMRKHPKNWLVPAVVRHSHPTILRILFRDTAEVGEIRIRILELGPAFRAKVGSRHLLIVLCYRQLPSSCIVFQCPVAMCGLV
eukprot:833477-Amphidinium_carterae.2